MSVNPIEPNSQRLEAEPSSRSIAALEKRLAAVELSLKHRHHKRPFNRSRSHSTGRFEGEKLLKFEVSYSRRSVLLSSQVRLISPSMHQILWFCAIKPYPLIGKLNVSSLGQAVSREPTQNCLHITDRASNLKFLIDTGATISVLPGSVVNSPRPIASNYNFFAGNGTPIRTYGDRLLRLNLGLRKPFNWRFIITDVSRPIIGADFLTKYNLPVDLHKKRLIDQPTNLFTVGETFAVSHNSIHTVHESSEYHRLLQQYLQLTNPGSASHCYCKA